MADFNRAPATGDYGHRMARLMGMTDGTWARHANPWSFWTRVPILPLMALCIWARAWTDLWWMGLALLVGWAFVNPRAFPPPGTTDGWAPRATFGERVWLNRKAVPIPDHHETMARRLSLAAGLGLIPLIYGLVAFEVWAVLAGLVVSVGAKLWFCDRMVWLYADMIDADPAYRAWLR